MALGFEGIEAEAGAIKLLPPFLIGFQGMEAEAGEVKLLPPFLQGFQGLEIIETQFVKVVSVQVNDVLGNIGAFAITNAVLEDITGRTPAKVLTFAVNNFTANEGNFNFAVNAADIRISYDIAGLTLSANAFNLSYIEAIPILNLLP